MCREHIDAVALTALLAGVARARISRRGGEITQAESSHSAGHALNLLVQCGIAGTYLAEDNLARRQRSSSRV
jgi:hypothetical protein